MRRPFLLLLLATVIAALSFHYFRPLDAIAPLLAQPAPPQTITAPSLPAWEAAIPANYPRPTSAWQENEALRYATLMHGQYDVLVVPFQIDAHGFDRATRSLLTAKLALAVERNGGKTVPDTYWVGKALGENARKIDDAAITKLAAALKVKQIIQPYIGHNQAGALTIRLKKYSYPIGSAQHEERIFSNIPFNDAVLPFDVLDARLPEIVAWIAGSAAPSKLESSVADTTALSNILSESPAAAGPQNNPVQAAYRLQLLGSLLPPLAERSRERLFEHSLLVLQQVDPTHADYRYLKARALMSLNYRPAALVVLAQSERAEDKALQALLNGNLTDLEAILPQIKSPVHRVLTQFDIQDLRTAFGLNTTQASLRSFESVAPLLVHPSWADLTKLRLGGWDTWSNHSNVPLKRIMERDFPLPGYALEDIVRGAAALADYDRVAEETELSVFKHSSRVLEDRKSEFCCKSLGSLQAASEYLLIFDDWAIANLYESANFYWYTQARPDIALAFLDRIEHQFKGQPLLTAARAHAQLKLAEAADEPKRAGLKASGLETAYHSFYWSQGQTAAGVLAWSARSGPWDRAAWPLKNWYVSDLPFRPDWAIWTQQDVTLQTIQYAIAAVNNSVGSFNTVRNLAWHLELRKEPMPQAVLDDLERRFRGNPARNLFLADQAEDKADYEAAIRYYRASINETPNYWNAYRKLSVLLFRIDRANEAYEVAKKYPGFNGDAEENRVALSSYAFEIGSLFFWVGDVDHAIPFYTIARDLGTGSEGSMSSAARLKLLQGDFAGAAAISLSRAQRYESAYAYRDYLGFLHLFGESEAAWAAFKVLAAQQMKPQIWDTALVGHQLEGKSGGEIEDWVEQGFGNLALGKKRVATRYAVLANVVDRVPDAALIQRIEKFEASDRPPLDTSMMKMSDEALADYRRSFLTSPIVFLNSYSLIQQKKYAEALAQFANKKHYFSIDDDRYVLPYYIWAAMKSGQADIAAKVLSGIEPKRQEFDYLLSKAVFAGLSGSVDESISYARKALANKPYTEMRPIYAEYQYAEFCEWLYEETQDKRFKDLALDWAKKHQRLQPWHAWAYAMEAKLTDVDADRRRAAGIALHLDRNSQRLSSLSEKQRSEGKIWYGKNKPFLIRTAGKGAKTGV